MMDSAIDNPQTAIAVPEPITARKSSAGRVLLPYQEAWRRDPSRLKLWEKSRRIGATYTEANDATMDRLTGRRNVDYWFSSADESAAYEFAEYCRFWSKVAGQVADYFTEQVEDPLTRKSATAFCVRFPSGKRITAMSSSPRRFRSKGGDVCLDEFAYHDDAPGMWDAASPTATLGDRIKVLSTHNGEGSEFNKFVKMAPRVGRDARPTDMPWSIHRVTILDAVEQGLVEHIIHPKVPEMTREQFIAECRARCRNEDQWNQEYMAIPSMDATAWLPYELIESCQDELAGDPRQFADGPRYLGADIGEVSDPTTIYWGERVGDVIWVRERIRLVGAPLNIVESEILARLTHPKTVRGCVDATGLGTQIGQAAQRTGRGEAIKFTLPVKDELASPLRGLFEDRRVRIPIAGEVREDLHSVRMTRTASGHPRFDAARTESGHADEFWALALMCHAARSGITEIGAHWL
jgi:phage FluMu gp28-like protein